MKRLIFATLLSGVLAAFTVNDNNNPSTKTALRHVNYTIFGQNYARTPIYDSQLKGHVYYITSGHGGPDPGAMTEKDGRQLSEDEYAYDVCLRLARNLLSHGAKVYMIVRDENDGIRDDYFLAMDKDETVWGGENLPLNQKARLKQRTDIVNRLYKENKAKGYSKQRAIEIHIDSRYVHQKVDIFFYHKLDSEVGRKLNQTLYRTIKSKYDEKQKDRGYLGVVSSRDLWMLRETLPTSSFIELGNLSNDFDQRRLLIPDNRQAIANWLALGLMRAS